MSTPNSINYSKAELRNLEEALVEIVHVKEKFKSEVYQKAFNFIWEFLEDFREFLVGESAGEFIPVNIGLANKNEQATVVDVDTLTADQKNSIWLFPENKNSINKYRDFVKVKEAFELLTNAPGGKNFLPPRATQIVSSFINTYDYIFSSGTFSYMIHII